MAQVAKKQPHVQYHELGACIVKASYALTFDPAHPVIKDPAFLIEKGRIVSISTGDGLKGKAKNVIDLHGKVSSRCFP